MGKTTIIRCRIERVEEESLPVPPDNGPSFPPWDNHFQFSAQGVQTTAVVLAPNGDVVHVRHAIEALLPSWEDGAEFEIRLHSEVKAT